MLVSQCLPDLRGEPLHRARLFHVVVRKDLGVCQPQERSRTNTRIRRMKLEIRISELRHPMVGVVSGVVDTLRSAKAPIRDWNSKMIVETREIGAATGITHLWLKGVGCEIRPFSPDIVNAALMARVRHLLGNVAQQRTQRW